MAHSAQSALPEQREHGGEAGTIQDFSVGYLVSPADAKDAAETSQVKADQLLLLLGVRFPCLTPVQEGADDACVVYCHLGCNVLKCFFPFARKLLICLLNQARLLTSGNVLLLILC